MDGGLGFDRCSDQCAHVCRAGHHQITPRLWGKHGQAVAVAELRCGGNLGAARQCHGFRCNGYRRGHGLRERDAHACGFNFSNGALGFLARISEPIGAPNAVKAPAQAFQHALAQAVAIAGRQRAVISGAVTFDGQQITARLLWVAHGHVNEITGCAHLRLYAVAARLQGMKNLFLERGVGGAACFSGNLELTRLRILQKILQGANAVLGAGVQLQFIGGEVAEHAHAQLGARDENVEAAMTAIAVEGAKFFGNAAGFVATVANADEHHIPLVALDVFEVFDKKRLVGVRRKKALGFGVGSAHHFNLNRNEIALRHAECSHAQAQMGCLHGVPHDFLGHCLRFNLVGSCAPAVVHGVRQMGQRDACCVCVHPCRRKDDQPVVVELCVGHGNERFMPTAVVPAQVTLVATARLEHAQDAFNVTG